MYLTSFCNLSHFWVSSYHEELGVVVFCQITSTTWDPERQSEQSSLSGGSGTIDHIDVYSQTQTHAGVVVNRLALFKPETRETQEMLLVDGYPDG